MFIMKEMNVKDKIDMALQTIQAEETRQVEKRKSLPSGVSKMCHESWYTD